MALGDITLETDAVQLKEAVVTANIPKMVIKDDTVVYNADAFRVPEGSVIEALVEALPGAKVDDDEDEIFDDNIFGGGDTSNIMSVKSMQKLLDSKGITREFKSEIMYGALPEKKKLSVMEKFSEGEIRILISTTVIEVGVDNPNANLMVIMDADRFGLSTLHQLRGRVGRSDKDAFCILVSESRSELALQRMLMMCESSDGFELAEADLKLRGPGDFFGTRQHGIPSLRAANLYTDMPLVKEALEFTNEVLEGADGAEKRRILEAVRILFALRFGDRMGGL